MHALHCKTDVTHPVIHLVFQKFKILLPIFWLHKELDFHLLKFTNTENKVTRSNLITKCLTNLCDSKRKLRVERINDVFEIHKDTLSSFGTEIDSRSRIFHCTNLSGEHHIERTRSTNWSATIITLPCFFKLIFTEAALTLSTLNKRIRKSSHMT